MRLLLIPISTRRTLLYCKKVDTNVGKQLGLVDRITNKASVTWAEWEQAEKGWKKTLVAYGHQVLQRIPYQEWGLKSVPPLSSRREAEELRAHAPVNLLYPGNVIPDSKVLGLLRKLATERQELHKKRMWWSLFFAPLTAPIALIPIIPNIPFFYLAYRGWSHWRAWSGSKHLVFLLDNKLVNPMSLPQLEHIYSEQDNTSTAKAREDPPSNVDPEQKQSGEDEILIDVPHGKELAKVLGAPELAAEVERAVGQVKHMHKENKAK